MSGAHSDIGPELRRLAQVILDGIDPAVRAAAALTAGGGPNGGATGKCQQVWCPVCALAALVNGEQHPLLSVIAVHSVALLAVVRAMAESAGATETPQPPDAPPTATRSPTGSSTLRPAAHSARSARGPRRISS